MKKVISSYKAIYQQRPIKSITPHSCKCFVSDWKLMLSGSVQIFLLRSVSRTTVNSTLRLYKQAEKIMRKNKDNRIKSDRCAMIYRKNQEEKIFASAESTRKEKKANLGVKKTVEEEDCLNASERVWHTCQSQLTANSIYLELGAQRMYMQPTRFPRLDRARKTSVVSSSLWEYWNSARSVRWSFHPPSTAPVPPLPATEAPLRARRLDVPVAPGAAGPTSGSGRKVYVGSGGRKASLAAMRLGQGGQQNRQQSSLRERPFILHWEEEHRQEDHCANEFTSCKR